MAQNRHGTLSTHEARYKRPTASSSLKDRKSTITVTNNSDRSKGEPDYKRYELVSYEVSVQDITEEKIIELEADNI